MVIDLTNNIGGQVNACLDALTFIMDDAPFASHNPLTGSEMSITLNGTLPSIRTTSGPSYQRAYEIFVMTSDLSFSCANLFPTVVKASGAATLIGMKSAGGACFVLPAVTPDGMPIQLSGNTRACLAKGSGKLSNDGGITPDVELDSSYFYDLQKLSAKLNQYVS